MPGFGVKCTVDSLITRRTLLAASFGIGLAAACDIAAAQTSACKLVKIADWPVRLVRDHIIVDGAINGQPVAVMLDTGANRTLIFRIAAERLGLVRADARRERMFGVGGETRVEVTLIDEFKVGDATRRGVRMFVAGERDVGADVLLGEDFFQLIDVEFDLSHDVVRLFQPQNCEGVSLAYWASAGAGEVRFEPLDATRPQITFTVEINGHPVRALLDSGASLSVLDKAEAARVGVTPETPGVTAAGRHGGLGSKSIPSWMGPFQSFTIGNETIRDTQIRFADVFGNASYVALGSRIPVKIAWMQSMLLGVDFLRSHRVLVAHSQQKIYFTYSGGPVFQLARP